MNARRLITYGIVVLFLFSYPASKGLANAGETVQSPQGAYAPEHVVVQFAENSPLFMEFRDAFDLQVKQSDEYLRHLTLTRLHLESDKSDFRVLPAFFELFGIEHIKPLFPEKLREKTLQGLERAVMVGLDAGFDMDELLSALNQRDDIDFAEPDFIAYGAGKPCLDCHEFEASPRSAQNSVNDPNFNLQYGLKNTGQLIMGVSGFAGADINISPAWQRTTGSQSIVLAVLDTGMPTGHNEFAGRELMGYNFVSNNTNYYDDHGHGSSVTSIAAANGNNGLLIAGTDWNSRIITGKVLNNENSGQYTWIAQGITYSADNGAHVINMSLGGSSPSQLLLNAVNYAMGKGSVIVACMMNENNNVTYYPAGYPGVISIGATNNRDQRAVPFSWGGGSNYGDHIDFVAPGDRIASLGGTGFNQVWYWSGTSMSAPFVAGVITLMLAINPSLTRDQIYETLKTTIRPQVFGGKNAQSGWDQFVGWGRIDAGAAIELTWQNSQSTGITEDRSAQSASSLRVFPNPAVSVFRVSYQGTFRNAWLSDMAGNIISGISFTPEQETIWVDTQGLPGGFYVLQLETDQSISATKVIVQQP